MADVNISSDALLVTTLNDNDRVTITREATAQQVATMRVGDFKKTVGIDYSLLTEQAIPGEYYLLSDGTKKQVYTRTFLVDHPNGYTPNGYGHVFNSASFGILRASLVSAFGVRETTVSATEISCIAIQNIFTIEDWKGNWGGVLLLRATEAYTKPCKLIITFHYYYYA